MAYSNKIHDQAFDKYLQNSKNWKFQFSLILAALAIIGFWMYGAFSDEMDNPEAIQIGLVIALMFILIGFFSGRSKSGTRDWDGVVIDKKIKKTYKDTKFQGSKVERYSFTVFIKSETGKIHDIWTENDDTVYNYYKIGDKVRYHSRLKSYEKFDKSGDKIIFCSACAFMHDIEEDVCRNCGCPLLK